MAVIKDLKEQEHSRDEVLLVTGRSETAQPPHPSQIILTKAQQEISTPSSVPKTSSSSLIEAS